MVFDILKNSKGAISSKPSKELAAEVLAGNSDILTEAVALVTYNLTDKKDKQIRAGAAKIVETVAEKKPELVAEHLAALYPALEAEEPQTRWMVIRLFGYCAHLNSSEAIKGIDYAESFIKEQAGVCLSGAAERYLGHIGALSAEEANKVCPILLEAYKSAIPNEIDWIFEGFIMLAPNLTAEQKAEVAQCADEHLENPRKTTVKRVNKLLKLCR